MVWVILGEVSTFHTISDMYEGRLGMRASPNRGPILRQEVLEHSMSPVCGKCPDGKTGSFIDGTGRFVPGVRLDWEKGHL